MAVACSKSLVALWIHSSVVFIKMMMTKKLSVQHPTANLPRSHQCSHDLLALKHTEAHTLFLHTDLLKCTQAPGGVMSLFSAILKGRETEFKLLIVRREGETELLIMPLKEEKM